MRLFLFQFLADDMMLFSPVSNNSAAVLTALHSSILLSHLTQTPVKKVIHAVLLSCIEITVRQFLCSSRSQSSVKASVSVTIDKAV